ncbi:MAG: hypothetical protein PVG21_08585 [Gammaproteobacteria bacterium]|jgi:hypothetical protein
MLRKILIGLVAGVALAYGSVKFYLAHSIGKVADQMIAMASPVAEIRYRGTTSSLAGMVGLTGIVIRPRKDGDVYRIGALKLKTDSLFTLSSMDERLKKGEIPKMFGLEIENVAMPISDQVLDKAYGDLGLWGDVRLPFGSLACGARSGFSRADLEQMGIRDMSASMGMEIQREPAKNDILVKIHVAATGINTGNVQVSLAAPGGMLNPRTAMAKVPPLKSASLHFSDDGWHKRVEAFCAGESGKSAEEYLAAHAAAVKAALAGMGIGVSDELVAAYREFLKDGSSMTLSIEPGSPVRLDTLRFYKPRDALAYLSPTLQVNGRRIKSVDIEALKRPDSADVQAAPAAVAQDRDQRAFRQVPVDGLGGHVGDQVRLTTDGSRVFSGTLTNLEGRIARVRVRTYDGAHEEIVLLPHVRKAEVLSSGK